nr:DUF4329 domain-containing protein [Chryseobacterium indologenes]
MKVDRTTHFYPFGLEFGGQLETVSTINPSYRYSTQGQENQIDTKWSSYRWRNYDTGMARFFNVDPLAEKYNTWSPYAFSGNRVVDARELEGLEPHVLFNTRENAAANFGQQYNGKSILDKREIGALIYFKYVDGKKYYAYNNPTTGEAHGIPQGLNMKLPKGAAASAYIHAHGNEDKEYDDENFSGDPSGGGDKGVASSLGLDAFLVTPGGQLKYYDLSSNTEKTLRTNMPSDPASPERKNKINPIESPRPSLGDYRAKPKPFPNLVPASDYLPKPVLDDGLKSIEAMRQNREQTPLIDRKQLPRHQ